MTIRSTILALGVFGSALAPLIAQEPAAPQTHQLKATPTTVAWGHYWSQTPPVLRIKSGDAVEVHTLLTSSPPRLEGAGVAPGDVEQALRDVHNEVKDKGPGGTS